jgi:hypothetical protein
MRMQHSSIVSLILVCVLLATLGGCTAASSPPVPRTESAASPTPQPGPGEFIAMAMGESTANYLARNSDMSLFVRREPAKIKKRPA